MTEEFHRSNALTIVHSKRKSFWDGGEKKRKSICMLCSNSITISYKLLLVFVSLSSIKINSQFLPNSLFLFNSKCNLISRTVIGEQFRIRSIYRDTRYFGYISRLIRTWYDVRNINPLSDGRANIRADNTIDERRFKKIYPFETCRVSWNIN